MDSVRGEPAWKDPLLQAKVIQEPEDPTVSPTHSSSSSFPQGIKIYKQRWVVLGIFSLNTTVTMYIWIMSAIVADLMVCYYGITDTLLNFTSTSYMMVSVVFMLPATWFMDRYGLRLPVVLASAMVALGASIRVIGTGSQYFWIILLGQFIAAFGKTVFPIGGPLLSGTWFPSSERATATAIGAAMAPQVGVLLAMGVTPVVVHSPLTEWVCNTSNTSLTASPEEVQSWSEEVYYRWLYYQCAVAGAAILTFLLTVCAFHNAPPTPPSLSRQLEKSHEESEGDTDVCSKYLASFLLYLKNGYFMLFLITSGVFLATSTALGPIINEIISPYFPHKDTQIGYLGVVVIACSIVSMLIVGRILDWTKRFYLMNILVTFLGALSVAAVMVLIQYQKHFYMLFVGAVFLGATVTPYQALAYEYAVEMTYPLPKATTTGLLSIVSQVLSIAMILLVTPKLKVIAMWFIVGTTAFGAAVTIFTRPKLKRAEIDNR